MTTPLPEKIEITVNVNPDNLNAAARARYSSGVQRDVFAPDDLTPEARAKYDAYYAEKAKRKDPTQPGVAQEAIDCVEELLAAGRSPGEAWTVYGYSLSHALAPARNEERRVVQQLQTKPSKDVAPNPACPLDVSYVKAKHAISEYVAPTKPEGKPLGEPKVG